METPRQIRLRLEKEEFFAAWKSCGSLNLVAKKLKKSRSSVKSAAYAYRQMGYKIEIKEDNNDYNKEVYEPTPEQIKEACKEIQSRWSKHDKRRNLRSDWQAKPVEFESVDHIVHRKLSSSMGNE